MTEGTALTFSPIYDIHKTYLENIRQGPIFHGTIPKRIWKEEKEWSRFLGYSIASKIGVPAGPLLDSRWCQLAAALGFDIITYKTIRSTSFQGHPLPNIVMVRKSSEGCVEQIPDEADNSMSITNSFGMPSMPKEFLLEDIAKARKSLVKGQILIVSVVGTPKEGLSLEEDFARATLIAKEAGAHAIEANFSCPNVATEEGSLYLDAKEAYRIAYQVVKAASPLPVVIKLGVFPGIKRLKEILVALAKAKVRAVQGINSLPMKVIRTDGSSALGTGRETSGICGKIIRPEALSFIRQAAHIIQKERLDLELAGCGGVTQPEDFDDFLMHGAQVALSATGMMWNPYLAANWHQNKARKSNE